MSACDVTTHTKAPWVWYRAGGKWLLWGAHGRRPIVLSIVRGKLSVRDSHELMVPLDPQHPDAVLIAAAPALLDALRSCREFLEQFAPDSEALKAARAAIAEASPS